MTADNVRTIRPFQDELAALSSDSLLVIAAKSGHEINIGAPGLVSEAACLASTMSAQLAEWDRQRAAVVPKAGSLPAGTYRAEIMGDQAKAITGDVQGFKQQVLTWTLRDGRWTLSVIEDGTGPDETADIYEVSGHDAVFRIPTDWKIPRTPGVSHLTWAVDANGTLTFKQVDSERREPASGVPWVRVSSGS